MLQLLEEQTRKQVEAEGKHRHATLRLLDVQRRSLLKLLNRCPEDRDDVNALFSSGAFEAARRRSRLQQRFPKVKVWTRFVRRC